MNSYMDPYVSVDPSDDAFFGKGSMVIRDSTGGESNQDYTTQ